MPFPTGDLARMRQAQDLHMHDQCHVQACVLAADTDGFMANTYPADGPAISCGLDMRPGAERRGVDYTTVEYDATIRLPITVTIDPKDRIKVDKRYGEDITPLVFGIVGPIQRGPSAIRLLLRRIEV
jgi:hypothetical protein